MNRRICDECKRIIDDGYVALHFSKMKEFLSESFDICEKCFGSIPKILKSVGNGRTKEIKPRQKQLA